MKDNKLYITWEEFGFWCEYVASKIRHTKNKFKNVYGLLRGGLPFATMLSHYLKIPLIVDEKLINKNTLICDEIADTGKSLKKYNQENVAVIFKNKKCKITPHYFGLIVEKWVVLPWEEENFD